MKLNEFQVRIWDSRVRAKRMHYVMINCYKEFACFELIGCVPAKSEVDLCTFVDDSKKNIIYENDIVSYNNETYQVVYEKGAFWIKNHTKNLMLAQVINQKPLEIIGNIHENADLLKEKVLIKCKYGDIYDSKGFPKY